MRWLWSWLNEKKKRKKLAGLKLRLYTRRGCHLCDYVHQLLETRRKHYCLAIEVVDVDDNPLLIALYGMRVPVVLVNGKERFRGRVEAAWLDRLLRAESARTNQ